MMIDLTVKTLDSQNHAFSLADDITIREFKELIADAVNVPADSQRLIYCGRVLQDEKRLSEYDVNGKVIHLVQRAPPQSTQRGNSGGGQSHGQSRGRDDQPHPRGMRYRQSRTQFHGNPMYLRSISIPAEVVEGHEWPIPQLSNTLSNSRLVIARRMLDQANRVLDRLENPTAAAATASTFTTDSSVPETDEASSGNQGTTTSEDPVQEQVVNTAQRYLRQLSSPGQMNGIYELAAAIAGSTTAPYVMQFRTRSDGSPETVVLPMAPATTEESQTPPQEQQPQQASRQGSANSATDQSGNARTSPSGTARPPRPPQMAQLLTRLMETQDRLRPFLLRYRELMELDPEIPGGRTASGEDIGTVEENQRIADGVTECFHFLSHANHALSDIIVDAGQQPPRNLRCRPMLIQHSAILQAGIPIQVEAHISVGRNDASSGESGEETNDATTRPPTSAAAAPSTTQNPIDLTFVTDQPEQTPTTPRQHPEQQQQQAQSQPQVDSPFGAIFNITNNMEVLMEMGSPESGGGITVSGVSSTSGPEQNQANGSNNNNNVQNNNNNAPGTSGVAGIFPWGPPPPPDVMRSLMNVVAGYMAQSVVTVAAAATTTTNATPTTCMRQRPMATGVGVGAAPNPGQSTQARSNVGTHPTTSTQTRSTARPHVFHPHAHPLGVGVGMGQNMDFDPFLSCNSHHIRRTPSATPNNSAATSSPQQTSQPSQSTTPNGNAQTQQDGPWPAAEQSAPSSAANQSSSSVRLRDEIANLRGSSGTESETAVTLEGLLLARGINITSSERSPGNNFLRHLFIVCSRIQLSEWYALLNNGKFQRDDTWRRLRPHLTTLMYNNLECERSFMVEVIDELETFLRTIWSSHERPYRDFASLLNIIIEDFVHDVAFWMKQNVQMSDDEEWGTNLMKLVKRLGELLFTTLRICLRRRQAELEEVIRQFATRAMSNQHGELREWVVGSVVDWFCEYSRIPEAEGTETTSLEQTNLETKARETQAQPEPESMDTDQTSSNRTINDPLDLDDGQEVPSSFPGHESLLPEWVPIIARDGIRQRRQLQLQGASVTAFSDAYLDGLPSKRRKLVDQQKPRLLVSPTPNHSAIPASMERLVRDSIVRSGVEEAEGAAAAVAADSGVRRAFGQAIRECLNPRRLQTPDFPDARRFPNATSYFTDKEKPAKQ